MKKIWHSKKGFSLIEMVVIIAIIMILAAAVIYAVLQYLDRGQEAADAMSVQESELGESMQQVNQDFVDLGY